MSWFFISIFAILAVLHIVMFCIERNLKHFERDFYQNAPQIHKPVQPPAVPPQNPSMANKFTKKRFTMLQKTDKLGKVLKFRGKNAHILRGDGNGSA